MAEARFFEIPKTVFPVVATISGHAGELSRADFFGTAFAIAPGIFMTAAHVALAAKEHGEVTICGPSADQPMMGGVRVSGFEIWHDSDVAILFCRNGGLTLLNRWLTNRVPVLTDLSSFGYPHAVTRENESEHFVVSFRAYKGHVITSRSFARLKSKPAVYEMSCSYPLGLSGAPVLITIGDDVAVAGIVIGSDTVEYGDEKHTVGIALVADEIASLRSEALGGERLGEALKFAGATFGVAEKE